MDTILVARLSLYRIYIICADNLSPNQCFVIRLRAIHAVSLYGRTTSAFESKSCILIVPCAARVNVSVVTRLNTDSRRNRGRGLLWSCSVGGRQGGHFRADERRDSKNCKTSLLAHRPKLSDCEFSSNADNTVYLRRANSVFIRTE